MLKPPVDAPIDVKDWIDNRPIAAYQWLILSLCFLIVLFDGFDVAAFDGQRAGDRLHGGGLAGAVGADQGDQLLFADFEVHALDRLDAAVCDLQAADFE